MYNQINISNIEKLDSYLLIGFGSMYSRIIVGHDVPDCINIIKQFEFNFFTYLHMTCHCDIDHGLNMDYGLWILSVFSNPFEIHKLVFPIHSP